MALNQAQPYFPSLDVLSGKYEMFWVASYDVFRAQRAK